MTTSTRLHENVYDKAIGFWETFLSTNEAKHSWENLLDPRIGNLARNAFLLALVKHATDVYIGTPDTKKASIIWSMSAAGHAPLKRAPSWLWHQGSNTPSIIVDRELVKEHVSVKEFHKIMAKLIVHEIGHIILHWEKLKPSKVTFANNASRDDEEEAWVFCGIIVGLVLGRFARDRAKPMYPEDLSWTRA